MENDSEVLIWAPEDQVSVFLEEKFALGSLKRLLLRNASQQFFPLFSFLAFFSWKKKTHWSLTVKWKNAWIISVLPSEMSQSKHICVTKYKLRAYQQIDLKSQHWAVILIVWIEGEFGANPETIHAKVKGMNKLGGATAVRNQVRSVSRRPRGKKGFEKGHGKVCQVLLVRKEWTV